MLNARTGLGAPYTSMGTVQIRLTGTARTDGDGKPLPSVTAPTAAEATSALDRMARVIGADAVLKPSTDYRRAALAAGAAGSLTSIAVTAWGTAVKYGGEAAAPPAPTDRVGAPREGEASTAAPNAPAAPEAA